jgi:hypothetical protein
MKKGTLVMLSVAAVAGMTSLSNAAPIGVNDFTSGGGSGISQTGQNGGGTTLGQNAQNIGPTVSQGVPYIGGTSSQVQSARDGLHPIGRNFTRQSFYVGRCSQKKRNGLMALRQIAINEDTYVEDRHCPKQQCLEAYEETMNTLAGNW